MAYIYALKTTLIKPNTNKQKQLLKLCLCASKRVKKYYLFLPRGKNRESKEEFVW